jgi:hypothetical protein
MTHIFKLKAGDVVAPPVGTKANTLRGVEYLEGPWKVSRVSPGRTAYALHLVPVDYQGPMGFGRIEPEEQQVIRSVKCSKVSEIEVVK